MPVKGSRRYSGRGTIFIEIGDHHLRVPVTVADVTPSSPTRPPAPVPRETLPRERSRRQPPPPARPKIGGPVAIVRPTRFPPFYGEPIDLASSRELGILQLQLRVVPQYRSDRLSIGQTGRRALKQRYQLDVLITERALKHGIEAGRFQGFVNGRKIALEEVRLVVRTQGQEDQSQNGQAEQD